MNLGEFRKATENLPDDTDLLGDAGDFEVCELNLNHTLPPVLEHSFAVILGLGAEVTMSLDLEARVDARIPKNGN